MSRTNEVTQAIITYLNSNGFVAWRNNNGAIYDAQRGVYRKNPKIMLGVGDIIGYRKYDGKYIEVEVKTGKDKLSPYQISHIKTLIEGNCISIVAHTLDDVITQIKVAIR